MLLVGYKELDLPSCHPFFYPATKEKKEKGEGNPSIKYLIMGLSKLADVWTIELCELLNKWMPEINKEWSRWKFQNWLKEFDVQFKILSTEGKWCMGIGTF